MPEPTTTKKELEDALELAKEQLAALSPSAEALEGIALLVRILPDARQSTDFLSYNQWEKIKMAEVFLKELLASPASLPSESEA